MGSESSDSDEAFLQYKAKEKMDRSVGKVGDFVRKMETSDALAKIQRD